MLMLEEQNNKLTHRECINLYLNPQKINNPNFQQAMKHLQKCQITYGN